MDISKDKIITIIQLNRKQKRRVYQYGHKIKKCAHCLHKLDKRIIVVYPNLAIYVYCTDQCMKLGPLRREYIPVVSN